MQSGSNQLTADSLAVFQVMVEHGDCLATTLPAACSLNPNRTEKAISDLVRAGLLRIVRGNPGHLQVKLGSPAALRGLLEGTAGPVLPRQAELLLRARQDLEHVLQKHQRPHGVDRVTVWDELQRRLEQLSNDTKREVFSLHAAEKISAELLDSHRGGDFALLTRGVSVNLVYPVKFARLDYVRSYVEDMVAAGANIRFADALPHRLVVSDGARAVVPIDSTKPRRGALFTTEPLIARSLRHLALSMFRSGREIGEIDECQADGPPSPLEKRVLMLMSSGITDGVAAKQLKVTDRTFRRYVANILTRLDATSRFQAGVKAVERGWI